MTISRRNLRKALIGVGCLLGRVETAGLIVGLALIGVGAVLHWLSKAYLEQNRDLTTAGPYRWTRNPFYLGNLLIDLGIACVIGLVFVAAVYFLLWGLAYRSTIRDEEEKLRTLFGARFEAYAAVVPAFFPTRRPLPAVDARGAFDLANPSLATGREYSRLLGILLAPAALAAAQTLRTLRFDLLQDMHWLALGLVLCVPALWVLKLALAETLRRPEVELLPSAGGAWGRALGAAFVLAPMCARNLPSDSAGVAGATLVLLAGVLALAAASLGGSLRTWASATLALAAIAVGVIGEALWLAVLPALWFGLEALDAWGCRRSLRASIGARRPWPYRPRIVSAVLVALCAVGAGRTWMSDVF